MNESGAPDVLSALAPLLPDPENLASILDSQLRERLDIGWRALTQLGFAIEVLPEQLKVRHPESGFETSIHLSRPEDLGELRRLFRDLRGHFGGRWERWLPALFQPGEAVTTPYQHLRAVTAACQQLRDRLSRPT